MWGCPFRTAGALLLQAAFRKVARPESNKRDFVNVFKMMRVGCQFLIPSNVPSNLAFPVRFPNHVLSGLLCSDLISNLRCNRLVSEGRGHRFESCRVHYFSMT
jgi:hypothetical protein